MVSYVLRRHGGASKPRVTVTDRDLEAYYQEHREEFKQEEEACASSHPGQGQAGARGQGGPHGRRGPKDRRGPARPAEGGSRLRGPRPRRLGGPGLGSQRRAISAASRAAAWCRSSTRRCSRSQPGQTSELVQSPFGYHVIRLRSLREELVPALAQVKERIRQLVTEPEGGGAGRPEVGGHRGDAGQRDARSRKRPRSRASPCRRARPSPAAKSRHRSPRPALVARALRDEGGRRREGGLPAPAGRRLRGPGRSAAVAPPGAQGRRRTQVKADLVEEKAFARAAAGQGPTSRRAAEGRTSTRRRRPLGLVRKETPGLVGRGQAPRRPRVRGRPRRGGVHASREDALRPGAGRRRLCGPPRPREEGLRPRGLRDASKAPLVAGLRSRKAASSSRPI